MKDSPALRFKSSGYPFGKKVPARVEMLQTVTADNCYKNKRSTNHGIVMLAPKGSILVAWTNSYGAVAVVLSAGVMLGVRPGEFKVVEWHE